MANEWNNVANHSRWRGVVSFIRNWIGPFDSDCGMAQSELNAILDRKRLPLPVTVQEWYLLATKWTHGGLSVWRSPQELTVSDETVSLLTDPEGITNWGIRISDFGVDDPPVVSLEENGEIASPRFSQFVAEMTVNDVIFDYETKEPVEVNRSFALRELDCFASSRFGDFLADGPLEFAVVVVFVYPSNGPALGKSRTADGQRLLQGLKGTTKAS